MAAILSRPQCIKALCVLFHYVKKRTSTACINNYITKKIVDCMELCHLFGTKPLLAPSQYPNQCFLIIYQTIKNIFQWNIISLVQKNKTKLVPKI